MCSRRRLETKPNPEAANLPRNTTENDRDDRVYDRAEVRTEISRPRRYPDAQGTLTTYCHGFFKANGRVFASYDVYELRLELISACVS